jgi:hypothetical protein
MNDADKKINDIITNLRRRNDELNQRCTLHTLRIMRLRKALAPFANYVAGQRALPEDMKITQGSPLARRQLTFGDCLEAEAALKETEEW